MTILMTRILHRLTSLAAVVVGLASASPHASGASAVTGLKPSDIFQFTNRALEAAKSSPSEP